jgi:hypothetical protein
MRWPSTYLAWDGCVGSGLLPSRAAIRATDASNGTSRKTARSQHEAQLVALQEDPSTISRPLSGTVAGGRSRARSLTTSWTAFRYSDPGAPYGNTSSDRRAAA